MIFLGDCRQILPTLDAGSIRTCVTSPPYWGLRDYGVDGQVGLEKTPEAYVSELVAVFREVRRVLADDGTLWLNLGDSYASDMKGSGGTGKSTLVGTPNDGNGQVFPCGKCNRLQVAHRMDDVEHEFTPAPRRLNHGLKPKDLVGIPWRVAFALQADGWYLRSDIIWHKPNPMPESVTDRPTKAHEYVFLLSKGPRYFYDAGAISETSTWAGKKVTLGEKSLSKGQANDSRIAASGNGLASSVTVTDTRNARTVWTIPTQPTPDAHFATFPEALAARCILAGSAEGDVVLDPFFGSGTVGKVAERLGRKWIGIELNEAYTNIGKAKTAQRGLFGGLS